MKWIQKKVLTYAGGTIMESTHGRFTNYTFSYTKDGTDFVSSWDFIRDSYFEGQPEKVKSHGGHCDLAMASSVTTETRYSSATKKHYRIHLVSDKGKPDPCTPEPVQILIRDQKLVKRLVKAFQHAIKLAKKRAGSEPF